MARREFEGTAGGGRRRGERGGHDKSDGTAAELRSWVRSACSGRLLSLAGVLLRQVQGVPSDALVHVQHIIGSGLKVGGRVVALGDEAPVLLAIIQGLVQVADLHKFLVD